MLHHKPEKLAKQNQIFIQTRTDHLLHCYLLHRSNTGTCRQVVQDNVHPDANIIIGALVDERAGKVSYAIMLTVHVIHIIQSVRYTLITVVALHCFFFCIHANLSILLYRIVCPYAVVCCVCCAYRKYQ
jgi:hypothetical protein